MHKCYFCNEDLVWQNDYDTDDVGQEDSEFLIVSMYQCSGCDAWYEIYHGKKEKDMGIWN